MENGNDRTGQEDKGQHHVERNQKPPVLADIPENEPGRRHRDRGPVDFALTQAELAWQQVGKALEGMGRCQHGRRDQQRHEWPSPCSQDRGKRRSHIASDIRDGFTRPGKWRLWGKRAMRRWSAPLSTARERPHTKGDQGQQGCDPGGADNAADNDEDAVARHQAECNDCNAKAGHRIGRR